jgi:hypothetical protein
MKLQRQHLVPIGFICVALVLLSVSITMVLVTTLLAPAGSSQSPATSFPSRATAPAPAPGPIQVVLTEPIPTHRSDKMLVKGEVYLLHQGLTSARGAGAEVILARPEVSADLRREIEVSRARERERARVSSLINDLDKAAGHETARKRHEDIRRNVQAAWDDFNRRGYSNYPFVNPYTNARHSLNWHQRRGEADRVFGEVIRTCLSKIEQEQRLIDSILRRHELGMDTIANHRRAATRQLQALPRGRSTDDIISGLRQLHTIRLFQTTHEGVFSFEADPGTYAIWVIWRNPEDRRTLIWLDNTRPIAEVQEFNFHSHTAAYNLSGLLP